MNKRTVERMLQVQDAFREEEEYRALLAEHDYLNSRFLEAVDGLDEQKKTTIFDYLGLLTEMHTKMLAYCCKEKSPEG